MISLNQTFEDTRAIKVLVVPIGENSLFDSHFQVVSRLRDYSILDLTRPSDWKKDLLKNFTWSAGSLYFDYLRYDRVPYGPGDLDNFQSSKRILMVMGLINYPELGSSADKIEEELEYFARRHSNIVLKRIFVFNYSFEPLYGSVSTPPKGIADDPNSLIIFPPDGICEGGSMIEVHLHEVMGNAGVKILNALKKQLTLCEEVRVKGVTLPNLTLCTLHDEMDSPLDASNSGKSKPRLQLFSPANKKKVFSGRIRKWMGDLCCQACSPVDALEHYNAAIAESRQLGDVMWLAGALEGVSTCILLMLKLRVDTEEVLGKDYKAMSSSSSSSSLVSNNSAGGDGSTTGAGVGLGVVSVEVARALRLAEERACEAMDIYSKNLVFCGLEVECTLRLAKMFEAHAIAGRDQKIVDYVMRAASVPGLNSMQQIECTLEGGLICWRLGLRRKYALFLYVAALMSAESNHVSIAHALMKKVCFQYGIETNKANRQSSESKMCQLSSPPDHNSRQATQRQDDTQEDMESHLDMFVVCPQDSWLSMRRAVLAHTAHVAKECGDALSASRSVAALLRLLMYLEGNHEKLVQHWTLFAENLAATRSKSQSFSSRPAAVESAALDQETSTRSSIFGNGNSNNFGESSSRESMFASSNSGSDVMGHRPSMSVPVVPRERGSVVLSARAATDLSMSSRSSQLGLPDALSFGDSTRRERQSVFAPPSVQLMGSNNNITHGSGKTSAEGDGNASENPDNTRGQGQVQGLLRNMSVPKLPPHVLAMVAESRVQLRTKRRALRAKLRMSIREVANTLNINVDGFDDSNGAAVVVSQSAAAGPGSSGVRASMRKGTLSFLEQLKRGDDVEILTCMSARLDAGCVPRDEEEQAVTLLEYLTREIAPVTAVQLPIIVTSARPLLLDPAVRPIKLIDCKAFNKAQTAQLAFVKSLSTRNLPSSDADGGGLASLAKASSLFYDPFAAQREREKLARGSTVDVVWSVGQVCKAVAKLSNPLAIPLDFENVTLLLKGSCKHELFPCSVHLAPNSSSQEIELMVKPLECGELVVAGINLFLNNSVCTFNVDEKGYIELKRSELSAPRAYARRVLSNTTTTKSNIENSKQLNNQLLPIFEGIETNKIKIVSAGAWLELQSQWPLDCHTRNHKNNGKSSSSIHLFNGEVRKANVRVCRKSWDAISDVRVTIFQESHTFESTGPSTIIRNKYIAQDFSGCLASRSTADLSLTTKTSSLTMDANGKWKQMSNGMSTCCTMISTIKPEIWSHKQEDFIDLEFVFTHTLGTTSVQIVVESVIVPDDCAAAVDHWNSPIFEDSCDEKVSSCDKDLIIMSPVYSRIASLNIDVFTSVAVETVSRFVIKPQSSHLCGATMECFERILNVILGLGSSSSSECNNDCCNNLVTIRPATLRFLECVQICNRTADAIELCAGPDMTAPSRSLFVAHAATAVRIPVAAGQTHTLTFDTRLSANDINRNNSATSPRNSSYNSSTETDSLPGLLCRHSLLRSDSLWKWAVVPPVSSSASLRREGSFSTTPSSVLGLVPANPKMQASQSQCNLASANQSAAVRTPPSFAAYRLRLSMDGNATAGTSDCDKLCERGDGGDCTTALPVVNAVCGQLLDITVHVYGPTTSVQETLNIALLIQDTAISESTSTTTVQSKGNQDALCDGVFVCGSLVQTISLGSDTCNVAQAESQSELLHSHWQALQYRVCFTKQSSFAIMACFCNSTPENTVNSSFPATLGPGLTQQQRHKSNRYATVGRGHISSGRGGEFNPLLGSGDHIALLGAGHVSNSHHTAAAAYDDTDDKSDNTMARTSWWSCDALLSVNTCKY